MTLIYFRIWRLSQVTTMTCYLGRIQGPMAALSVLYHLFNCLHLLSSLRRCLLILHLNSSIWDWVLLTWRERRLEIISRSCGPWSCVLSRLQEDHLRGELKLIQYMKSYTHPRSEFFRDSKHFYMISTYFILIFVYKMFSYKDINYKNLKANSIKPRRLMFTKLSLAI